MVREIMILSYKIRTRLSFYFVFYQTNLKVIKYLKTILSRSVYLKENKKLHNKHETNVT